MTHPLREKLSALRLKHGNYGGPMGELFELAYEMAKALEALPPEALRSEPHAHDWQPDGGVLSFESHPGGEAPHVHTTCAKCGARAWFLEYLWELLSEGCAVSPLLRSQEDKS